MDYNGLKTAITSWVERDDLSNYLDNFIDLAEARFNRIILTPEREASTTLTAAASVDLPADFWGIKSIWLNTDPNVVLEQKSLEELRMYWAFEGPSLPRNFAIQGGDTLVLGPAPDSDYEIELVYWTSIPAISAVNTSNWLLASHPDIYLFGCLVEAESFNVNDTRIAMWKARLDGAILELLKTGRRKEQSAAPQRIRAPYNT